jgi:UDP-N-acetylglucosamine:LPS N-acetylglucosamine transferase
MGNIKICIACSAGGHLTEILTLKSVFRKYNHFFVTFKREDIKTRLWKENIYFVSDPKRNPFKFLLNFFQSLKIFLKEKPDLVITNGAGVVIPLCYIAKFFGSKVIFIESLAAVFKPSLSGRIIYPIANLFIVQWKRLLKFYPKAIYGGTLI